MNLGPKGRKSVCRRAQLGDCMKKLEAEGPKPDYYEGSNISMQFYVRLIFQYDVTFSIPYLAMHFQTRNHNSRKMLKVQAQRDNVKETWCTKFAFCFVQKQR